MLQINKNIKLIRELSGKNQAEFARLIKTNLSNLKTYENTGVKPKALIKVAIAKVANITVEDLENKVLTAEDISFGLEKDKKVEPEITNQQLSGVIEANLVLARTNEEHTRMLNAKLQVANKDLTAILSSLKLIDARLANLEKVAPKVKDKKNEFLELHKEEETKANEKNKEIAGAVRKSRGSGKQKPDNSDRN